MAKGQQRSNREAKKPKANKKTTAATTGSAIQAPPRPLPVKGGGK